MSAPFELPFTSPSPSAYNGRVNLSAIGKGSSAPISDTFQGIPGFDYQKTAETNFQMDMLRGNWEDTTLSSAFFNANNVKTVQNLIRRKVYEKSKTKGYVIDNQSVDELKIIMRATYLQYGRNLPTNIPQQVQELNERVANWSVPHILSAVEHYMYYLDDISHMPVPMEHAVNVNRTGTRTLPTTKFM